MRTPTCLALAALALPMLSPCAARATPQDDLHRALQDYDVYLRQADPIDAAQHGDQVAAARWPDDRPSTLAAGQRQETEIQARLTAIPATALAPEDALNRELLLYRIDLELEGDRYDVARIPFTSDEGFYVVPSYAAEATVLQTHAQADAWLSRLRTLPAYYDTEISNMRRGLATGFTQPRSIAAIAARVTRGQADAGPDASPLLQPLDTLPATMPQAERAALKAEALEILRSTVKPAQQRLAAFLADEYVPHARTSLGASELPDGRGYYLYRVRLETTTGMTPDAIFALGNQEIARIRAEMQRIIAEVGFKGSFQDFQRFLRTDPRFTVTTREALLEKASRLAKRVDDQLPHYFGRLPRLTYGVRQVPPEMEEGYTTGRYDPGSPEQGVAGGLMINTSHLDQRPLYELPALVSHEGVPGHHIQIALSQELDLPAFRRDSELTAFVEGWALYSEQLTREMGLYSTPYERFGLLSFEMWRACRLVVDVGIHWKGWTRDQAVACLRNNTALADKNIQSEVDRYIAWPGQALGYKVGELRLMEIRHRAEAALGSRFDIRAFHDELLDSGAMPLDVLERRMNAWIETRRQN